MILRGRYRDFPLASCPRIGTAAPRPSASCQGVCVLQLTGLHCRISIPQSPQCALGLPLWLWTDVMSCSHRYSIVQKTFAALDVLPAPPCPSLPPRWPPAATF